MTGHICFEYKNGLVNLAGRFYNTTMLVEQKIATKLKAIRRTLSVAESCTGGLLAHRLTNVPGSSDYFVAGLVTYANAAKTRLLKVPAKILEKYGAVSPQTAVSMAKGICQLMNTDYAVGITGIAGPGGGTRGCPVGSVYICVAGKLRGKFEAEVKVFRFKGTRLQVKLAAVKAAGALLLEFIKKDTGR